MGPGLRRPVDTEVLGVHSAMWTLSSTYGMALAEGGRRFADQYVDGANFRALQIGSTPKRSR